MFEERHTHAFITIDIDHAAKQNNHVKENSVYYENIMGYDKIPMNIFLDLLSSGHYRFQLR